MAVAVTTSHPQLAPAPAASRGQVVKEPPQFTAGGYGSAGCSGCMPLGCFEMRTVPPQSPSFFAAALAKDLLALAPAKSTEKPSPKSVTGFDFEADLKQEKEIEADQAAWQRDRHTD
ncbi:hypothetical protein ABPG75_011519 [Micractinium tetrahymenae]